MGEVVKEYESPVKYHVKEEGEGGKGADIS